MNERPNFLLVITDQQSLRAMSAYGNPHIHTPHMDAIAANGVRFEKSYCTSPVCGPARSSLVTGRMPHEVGVNLLGEAVDPSVPNLGEMLRAGGYETAWAGKWHLAASYPQRTDGIIPGFELLRATGEIDFRLGAEADKPYADAAIDFLRGKPRWPFLLVVSLHNPHDICWWVREEPVSHSDLDGFPPLPPNFAVDPDEPEFVKVCRARDHYGPEILYTENWDEAQWRAYLNAYYRLTERADAEIGRVLAALRDEGLEDDTVIVFTSDHGEGMAAHRWVVKLMLYEEVVTVPLVVSWKDVTPANGVDREHLVSGTDVVPTLCDYAGIRAPDDVTGISLRPLIEDPAAAGRECLVTELHPDPEKPAMKGRMLRTRRFKYVAFSEGRDPEMLFDLEIDPGEVRNLIRDPGYEVELARHRRLLNAWIVRTGDEFIVPGGDYRAG